MIRVIDGRRTISSEVIEAHPSLTKYIQEEFTALLNEPYIDHAVTEHVDSGRERLVFDRIRAFTP